jgi:uncharacterized membrane protein
MKIDGLGSCNSVSIQIFRIGDKIQFMELIDSWGHSANTLALVIILLAVLVALVASGLSIVPTAILLCVGLIAILSRSTLASSLWDQEVDKPNSDDHIDTLKEQYVKGILTEDELGHKLTSSLDEEKADDECRDRQPVTEHE